MIQSLYIHIPFCIRKCCYCEFYSIDSSNSAFENLQRPFVNRLCRDLIHLPDCYNLQITSIFIGGGTPTCLPVSLWSTLLHSLHNLTTIDDTVEFTVEANPESVTLPLLNLLKNGGVNRLSIGAQSFNPTILNSLNRVHTAGQTRNAVEFARMSGINNINLDLIFAVPGQTQAMLLTDLDELTRLKPRHVSCYNLTYEPGTPLYKHAASGLIQRLDEESEATMYENVIETLRDKGFHHYEISNWALTNPLDGRDYRCRHNLGYWLSNNWIGLGPSSASHVDGRRWKLTPQLETWLSEDKMSVICEDERLDPDRQAGEIIMMNLRLTEGISHHRLNRLLPPTDRRRAVIHELLDQNLLESTDTHLRLSHKGVLLADHVSARLL